MVRIPTFLGSKSASTGTDELTLSEQSPSVDGQVSAPTPPADEEQFSGPSLRRMRQVGLAVFALQLIGFGTWSTIVWDRFALTWDFSLLYGATSKISHSSPGAALNIIEAHFDAVILWPLAWLIRLPLNGLILLWVQDLAVVIAGAVGFFWVCEILERRSGDISISIKWLAGLALVLLVANPWVFLTPAFDFHLEALGALFIVLAARSLYNGNIRTSLLWIAATITCGFVAASYVAGLAIGAIIAGTKPQRIVGVGLLATGVLGVVLLTEVGQGAGFLTFTYGYLSGSPNPSLGNLVSGVVTHPSIALRTLWSERVLILANLAPAGFLGLFWGWSSALVILIVLENTLQAVANIRVPSFQWFPLYLFVAIGTVMVLAKLSGGAVTRLTRIAVATLLTVVAADTLGWAAVWTPKLPGTWLRVSPGAADVLKKIDALMPHEAPVIVSQGVSGHFTSHPYASLLLGGDVGLPKGTRPIWVVLAPEQGIETVFVGTQQAVVTELGERSDAQLVASGAGVWGFVWSPRESTHRLLMPGPKAPIAGWVVAGAAGRSDIAGKTQEWAAVSDGQKGYVVSGDYFRRGLGTYKARIRLSSSGPAVVEAWDVTGDLLLSRFTVEPTHGRKFVSFPVTVDHLYPHSEVYGGWGPFSFRPPLPPGNDIELRVWNQGSSKVSVYSLAVS